MMNHYIDYMYIYTNIYIYIYIHIYIYISLSLYIYICLGRHGAGARSVPGGDGIGWATVYFFHTLCFSKAICFVCLQRKVSTEMTAWGRGIVSGFG